MTGLEITIRNMIKKELNDSDWTQLVDAPITYAKKLEWREFRQLLRELSSNSAFPNVRLPKKPE